MTCEFPIPTPKLSRRQFGLGTCASACSGWSTLSWAQGSAELEQAARSEGKLVTVGMPDSWANWRATWADLKRLYGLTHVDTDMSSAEELAKMVAEGRHGTVDLGDVGFEFGALARSRGVSAAYKPSTWAQIPDWAKDSDGHWALAYTGTIAWAVNTRRMPKAPRTWKELLASKARVAIGQVGRAAQANAGVLAAAVALGGHELQLEPALQAFARLAGEGRLSMVDPSTALMERGEADVFVMWDFNALAYREKLPNQSDYALLIPADGSVTSGYTTLINTWAPHPNAARLAREYIFSDAGQINLARGHARPIRIDHLSLPPDAAASLLASSQYQAARPIRVQAWGEATRTLGARWQAQVSAVAR